MDGMNYKALCLYALSRIVTLTGSTETNSSS